MSTTPEINSNAKNLSKYFGTIDYFVFIVMLIASSLVGLYFGCQDHRHRRKKVSSKSDSENYLMGGRNMQIFPVAMSLTATVISGISLLGKYQK